MSHQDLNRDIQQEIRWLIEEKYGGKRTRAAEKDIARLEKGEHVDYVIGWVDFLGCKIDLSQKPLIPRPETEHWTEQVIQELRIRGKGYLRSVRQDPPPAQTSLRQPFPRTFCTARILDMFAGSGCIGIAILKACPEIVERVDFAEKEKKFCEQIRINAKLNSINPKRCRIIQSDIFSHVNGQYDIILANPPYVPESRKHLAQASVTKNEPHNAVFGGRDGLQYIRPFLLLAKNYLRKGGVIYMEFDESQKDEIEKLAQQLGYSNIQCFYDQYKKWRYVRMQK